MTEPWHQRRGWMITVVALLLGYGVLFGMTRVVRSYRISTNAMHPTVSMGDQVLVNRLAYRSEEPERGDIVSHQHRAKQILLKRIVGLPGETVEIRDKQLFINGGRLQEPYVIHTDAHVFPRSDALPEPYRSRDQFGPLTVGPGEYFALGDNRDASADSRYSGPIPRRQLRGKVIRIVRSGSRRMG